MSDIWLIPKVNAGLEKGDHVMIEPWYIHVVDSDSRRRASIAHSLCSRAMHVEIYENLDELMDRSPSGGALLIADEDISDPKATIETIRSRTGYLPVAFFSANPSPQVIVRAMLSGALDYLAWPFSPEALHATVVQLGHKGEHFAKIEMRKDAAKLQVESLTPRERDVLKGIVAGGSTKSIAGQLGISPRTVEVHRGNMLARLNARSTSDALRVALYAGLVD